MNPYLRHTRSAYYAVVVSIPLLLAYEMLLAFGGNGMAGQVRNAGDVWLRMLLASLEVRPAQATLVMILLLLLSVPVVKRDDLALYPGYFILMGLEALVYSLALGLAINVILEFIFSAIPSSILGRTPLMVFAALSAPLTAEVSAAWPLASGALSESGVMQGLALSLGAGLFEEFIFRVLLLGGLLLVTRTFLPGHIAAVLSVILAAFLFSLAHYIGPLGDAFTFSSFMFRFVAGLLFTGLYHLRGFGVVAYAHAFYDIRVILF